MRIHVQRSGGVAGMTLQTTIDTESLTPEQAAQVERLVAEAAFFDLPASLGSEAGVPDEFQYEVTIEAGGRTHSVTTSESGAPRSLVPLLDWLSRAARRRPGRPP